jgi:benzoyl-CoA reductase/2-hydroxyglutaryl-CoA dehydratase subunit BcrC/BadD/HgdB
LGFLGVPPICSDLFDRLPGIGAGVVFLEVPRQFSMPAPSASLLEQYAAYTYPYDVFYRIEDVVRECRRRGVQGVIHYVQSFCFRQLQDRLIRERVGLPVLTLECDRPGPLDASSWTRLEAFVEMLRG